jgi:hypothetical protein
MKTILMLCFAFNISVMTVIAQRPERQMPPPEEMAKRQTQMMKDSLQLDEKQIAKVEAINLEYAQKMRKLMESEVPQGEKMQEFQLMQTNKDYEIKKCLNKEQAKRYQKMQEAIRLRRQERRKERE